MVKGVRRDFGGMRSRKILAVEKLEDRSLLSAISLTTPGAILSPSEGSATAKSAIFRQINDKAAGTGNIDAFVVIQAKVGDSDGNSSTEQGYNYDRTGGLSAEFEEGDSPTFNRALPLSSIPIVNIGGTSYREFLLDVNQQGNESEQLISLDQLRISVAASGSLTGYGTGTFGGAATIIYDIDDGADNWIVLDASLGSGSGSDDMLAYVPDSLFNVPNNGFVYLFSRFGDTHAANDGPEEWAVGRNATPLSPVGAIHGYKFVDTNGNGIDDDGFAGTNEPVKAGVQVFLDTNDNGGLDVGEPSTTTDANGEYWFTKLAAGLGPLSTYRVREVVPAGFVQTSMNPPPIVIDAINVGSMGNPTFIGQVFIAFNGQGGFNTSQPQVNVQPKLAFGNFQLGSIHGYKFADNNGNGTDDDGFLGAGEPGLAGVVVFIDANGNGSLDGGEKSTVTIANGEYSFEDLGPGDYLVREVAPNGYFQTSANPPLITLLSGQEYVAFDGQADLDPGQSQEILSSLAFGNILRDTTTNARTIGFWSNKNGQALITSADLVTLQNLNLKDGAGNDFDPANKAALKNWLHSANAVNMKYMLSAQLAAMQLNLQHGFVASTSKLLVNNPDGTTRCVTVGALITEANNALNDGSATRAYLESLKDALDAGNNNMFVV